MAAGYYFTMKHHKQNILQNGIHAIHPSGICLYAKPDTNDATQNDALLLAMSDMAKTIAKLHECDRATMFNDMIVFEVEYSEADITVAHNGYLVVNTREIPVDKIKFVGGFEDLLEAHG